MPLLLGIFEPYTLLEIALGCSRRLISSKVCPPPRKWPVANDEKTKRHGSQVPSSQSRTTLRGSFWLSSDQLRTQLGGPCCGSDFPSSQYCHPLPYRSVSLENFPVQSLCSGSPTYNSAAPSSLHAVLSPSVSIQLLKLGNWEWLLTLLSTPGHILRCHHCTDSSFPSLWLWL